MSGKTYLGVAANCHKRLVQVLCLDLLVIFIAYFCHFLTQYRKNFKISEILFFISYFELVIIFVAYLEPQNKW